MRPMLPRLLAALLPPLLLIAATPAAAQQLSVRTAQLAQQGFDALDAGDLETARDAFERGLEQDRDNPLLHLGLGVVAFQDRRGRDARRSLERALRVEPGLTVARILLARVLYQDGDLFGAIRELEQVVAANADDAENAAELELGNRMQQSLSDHFTVSYEGPPEEAMAVRALEVLDQAYWRLGQTLSVYPLRPVPVVLYTTEQFRDITRSPDWAGGAFDGTAIRVPMRGALDDPAELEHVLTHEFVHVLIHEIAPANVPYWLHEGLASALEGADDGWARELVATAGGTLPLEALVGPFAALTDGQAALAYATSELAVRRLLNEAGGIALANLVRDLGQGVPLADAFQHRLYRSLDQFLANSF
jgi:tetratricopeptide (TPR) repeat protein